MKSTRAIQHRPSRNARRAFTLIEAIVVIVIIGVLATLIAPRLIGHVGASKQSVAASNAAALATALKLYHADYGALPDSGDLSVLAAKPTSGGKGPYIDNAEQLIDPWGHKFVLKVPGEKNVDFDIVSYGADGKPGGDGENADIIKP